MVAGARQEWGRQSKLLNHKKIQDYTILELPRFKDRGQREQPKWYGQRTQTLRPGVNVHSQ